MKKIYICLSLLAVIVLGTACNNEWEQGKRTSANCLIINSSLLFSKLI